MIKIVNLKNTLNPISATERVKINENWDEIRRAFSSIQLQINFLAGGTEVNEIIERIENAIRMAETGSQQAIDRVNEAFSDLNVALNNLQTLTTETNAAKDNAISATNDAMNAIREISDFMNEFRSLGPYNSTTQYKRNNMASLNGNTYIALSDNVGVPTTNTNVWALFARRGFDGDRGPQGEAGASLNVRGSLPDESALPSTGAPGDAYTINGDLYVWSAETNGWVNVGQIKGEKGDRGEKGDSGYYTLANFQYTVPATSEGQTTIEIPLISFNPNDHSMLLFINSTALRNDQYSISGRTITLNEPVEDYTQTTFYLNITQGVLIQPLDTINGSSIENGTISNEKLNPQLINEVNNHEARITVLENSSNASNANVAGLNREVAYLKLRQQANERIEGGTVFADDFGGSRFGFELKSAKTKSTSALSQGETILTNKIGTVNNGQFTVGSQIAILDSNNFEIVTVTRSENVSSVYNLEVSPLTKNYINGSIIAESTINDDGSFGYASGANENSVLNSVVTNNTMSSLANGGRKLVRLENGWLVSATINNTGANKPITLYVSKDNGFNWQALGNRAINENISDFSLISRGNTVNLLLGINQTSRACVMYTLDVPNVPEGNPSIQTIGNQIFFENAQTEMSKNSLVYDEGTNTLHAAWVSKNSTYVNSFNVRYASSTDGGLSWNTPIQVTKSNNASINWKDPSIVVREGIAYILAVQESGTASRNIVALSTALNTNTLGASVVTSPWKGVYIHTNTLPLANVSATVNDSIINVVWDVTSGSTKNIDYSESIGVGDNWTNAFVVTQGQSGSIAIDKNGTKFIVFENSGSTYYTNLERGGTSWSNPNLIVVGTSPNALDDNSLIYNVPPIVKITSSSVVFSGNWLVDSEIATRYSVVNYVIPSTDYVGAFVKKSGNVTIQAYLNNQLITSELLNDEYSFEGQLISESPVTLRLELSRTNISNGTNDRLTRILGGRS